MNHIRFKQWSAAKDSARDLKLACERKKEVENG